MKTKKQNIRTRHVAMLFATIIAVVPFTACNKEDNNSNTDTNTGNTLTLTVGEESFTMVKVEPGVFMMGALEGDTNALEDEEKPVHQVTLTGTYYIGQTEVTQELYTAVMGSNPSNFTEGNNLPVEKVSYNDALEFCRQLSSLTGKHFTLPTEAQWEYAARGGHKTPSTPTLFAGSDDIDAVGWYKDNSDSTTHTVAKKAPNALGLYDMTGNVFEWCLDWYGSYTSDAATDPQGPADGSERVSRGGSWNYPASYCRTSIRACSAPDVTYYMLGFRVVMLP